MVELSTDGNRLSFVGRLDITAFRRPIAALHNMISSRGYQDVVLDFSRTEFTHAPAFVPIVTDCQRYRTLGVDFEIILPEAESLRRLFINSNWAHFLDPDNFQPSSYSGHVHLPIVQFKSPEDQFRSVDLMMQKLLASITEFNRDHFKAIEWSLNEITDNVLVHSHSTFGGFVQLTALKQRKRVEFVVSDAGIGIPASLKQSAMSITSDVDAVARAIEQGVTRDISVGQGNGLYGSYQIAVNSGGSFNLSSGNATLYYTPTTGMHTRSETIPFHGTLVVCGIDYTAPLRLEQALRIRGRPFNPADMIETRYDISADNVVLFKIRDEAASLGSRVAGTPVRNKLRNLLAFLPKSKIEIDFSDVRLISSSFADEAFGKLFAEIGALDFAARLSFKNVDSTVKQLIDKAITQRVAASFYSSLGPKS
jgi:hypothetical protein